MTSPSLNANLQQWQDEALATLEAARLARSEVEQRRLADAVIALFSCRLAAAEHVLIPALAHDRSAQPAARALLARARDAERVLRLLEEHLTGEIHVAGASRERLLDEVHRCLNGYASGERRLHDALGSAVGEQTQHALLDRVEAVTRAGPTRPHPYGPHLGPLEATAYRVHVVQDRVRDTLDSRQLPHPAPPRSPKKLGLWAAYALGRALPDARPRGESPAEPRGDRA